MQNKKITFYKQNKALTTQKIKKQNQLIIAKIII